MRAPFAESAGIFTFRGLTRRFFAACVQKISVQRLSKSEQGRTPRALPCVGLTVLLDRLYSRFGHVQRARLRLAVRPGQGPARPCRTLLDPARPRVIRLASYLDCTARPIGAGDVASHVTGRLARWLIQGFVQ